MAKSESKKTTKTVTPNSNMVLWEKVCETNPDITKRVTVRGGFTSIDAQTQVKRATELWGQYGHKWGMRDLSYEIIYDAGKPIGLSLVTMFYYPIISQSTSGSGIVRNSGNEGKFPISSDMAYKPTDDCYKKLATDALTKALSRLGFNSDVFEGKFDDSKYVAEMKKKYKADATPDVKEYTPNAKAKELLEKIAEKFNEELDPHISINMDKLTAAVFNKYGKYPSKVSAINTIVAAIDVLDIL